MKKTAFKIISLLLSLTMVLTLFLGLCVNSFAVNSNISDFRVSTKNDITAQMNDIGVVSWWYNEPDSKYYVFLPSYTSLVLTKVWFTSTGTVTVNGGAALVSGTTTAAFAAGGEFTLNCSGESYTVVFVKSSSLPAVFINTSSGSMSAIDADETKETKESGTMLALTSSGTTVYDNTLKSIKGRGNATWKLPKRPYNIKLDKSTDLYGMGKSKNWCLLANYNDLSLLKNEIIYNLAIDGGLDTSCESQQIDLYLNGQYNGTYLLTEKVEIAKTRVNITDLEALTEEANSGADLSTFTKSGTRGRFSGLTKGEMWLDIPTNPADITGGYLLEYEIPDRYPNEASGFVTSKGQAVVLKSPEYASEAQVKYISDYVQQMEDAIYSSTGYNKLGKHYSEYIDVESMARMFVIQEWSENLDAGISSFYLYKDTGDGKIYAGPAWDFDAALGGGGERFGYDLSNPEIEWARNSRLYKNSIFGQLPVKNVPTILNALYKHTDFVKAVKNAWDNDFKASVDSLVNTGILQYADSVKDSAVMNAIRWNLYSTSDQSTLTAKYTTDVNTVQTFASKRTSFLNGKLGLKNEKITIAKIDDQTLSGNAVTPEVTVTCLDKTLVKDTDYIVTYKNNTAAGKGEAIVIGIGDYGTSASQTFNIVSSGSQNDPNNGNGTNGNGSNNNGNSNGNGDASSNNPDTSVLSDSMGYFFLALPATAAAVAIATVLVVKRKKENED